MHEWDRLGTEGLHPGSADLDRLDPVDAVRLLLDEDARGLDRAREQAGAIAEAAGWMHEALERGGRVLLVGAGTSGRLAVLEAAELPPTFGTDPERVQARIAGGEEAMFQAREGAEDRADDGRRAAADLGPDDLLIGVSASSVTPFVAGALAAARERGARTVLVTCASPAGGPDLAARADLLIALDTGPEVLAGSTRLKAGSATKAALNALTTTAMVRWGKVYGHWMVDLRPGSAKLRDRSLRIIAAAAGVSREEAERLREAAGGEIKTAIVAGRRGLEPEAARRLLERAGGRVREALDMSL